MERVELDIISSPETEKALLGCLMVFPEMVDQVAPILDVEDFYVDNNKEIYKAILNQKGNSELTYLSVAHELGARLQVIGGLYELTGYLDYAAHRFEASEFARIITEKARARRIVDATHLAARELTAGASLGEIEHILRDLSDSPKIRESTSAGRHADEAILAFEQSVKNKGRSRGLSTGFWDLDKKTGGFEKGESTVLASRPSQGKAQPLSAQILMREGTWKRMGDVVDGDEIASIDGAQSKVFEVFEQGYRKVFRVEFWDGRSIETCAEHLWCVRHRHWVENRILTTERIAEMLKRKRYCGRLSIDLVSGDFGGGHLPIDPYVLGALIGDGGLTQSSVRFSSADNEILNQIRKRLGNAYQIKKISKKCDYRIVTNGVKGHPSELINSLRDLGLKGCRSENKFIPAIYLRANRADRLDLLRGLMDTDGYIDYGPSLRFSSSSKKLAQDVQYLVRSLGGVCKIGEKQPIYTYKGKRLLGLPHYICRIRHIRGETFFNLRRKKILAKRRKNPVRLTFKTIVPVGDKKTRCISVSHPSGLYIADDFTVTHNTALATGMAHRVLKNGGSVFFASLEMTGRALIQRLAYGLARVDGQKYNTGDFSLDESRRLKIECDKIRSLPLEIDDTGGQSVDGILAKARSLNPDIVIIDYLQLLAPTSKGMSLYEKTTENSLACKTMAKNLGIPVLLLSQLSRAPETRGKSKRPVMSDLRESGAIEENADHVWLLYRPETYDIKKLEGVKTENLAKLIIAKNRNGPTGTVRLTFLKQFVSFEGYFGEEPL